VSVDLNQFLDEERRGMNAKQMSSRTARHAVRRAVLLAVLLALTAPLRGSAAQAQAGDFIIGLSVSDAPSDGGNSLDVTWSPAPLPIQPPLEGIASAQDLWLRLERRSEEEPEFVEVAIVPLLDGAFRERGLVKDVSYQYRLALEAAPGQVLYSEISAPVAPAANFFRLFRLNALVAMMLMGALVVAYIMAARRGADLYIRRIAGLDAIDEAVGRATEMGRKILFVPGIISINEPQTLAALGILGYVAKLTARYGTGLEVPNADPLTMAAAREIVKQSYLEEGAPEGFQETMVNYITQDQFAYAGAVSGIMVRDRPAAVFLLGWFAAESLLLSETGQSIQAIQIAGTAQVTQLPFFVAACDYTMLGEELFAASAYLSRDPLILGSIKGQDMMKAAILAMIVIGVVMATFGVDDFVNWFAAL
jgi:hypothetical protein